MNRDKALDASMSNVLAWRLGDVATAAGNPNRKGIGDPIDRGLVLLRLLHEAGFEVRALKEEL